MLLWFLIFFGQRPTASTLILFPVILIISSVVFGGLTQGQHDRFSRYAEIKDQHAWCSNFVILRPVSNNFLAVGPDESRVIIDQECRVRQVLLSHDRYRPLPDKGGPQIIIEAISKLI